MSICISTAQARINSGYAVWPPAFFPVNVRKKLFLWDAHVHCDCADSHKVSKATFLWSWGAKDHRQGSRGKGTPGSRGEWIADGYGHGAPHASFLPSAHSGPPTPKQNTQPATRSPASTNSGRGPIVGHSGANGGVPVKVQSGMGKPPGLILREKEAPQAAGTPQRHTRGGDLIPSF
jgi:hypothetical protein